MQLTAIFQKSLNLPPWLMICFIIVVNITSALKTLIYSFVRLGKIVGFLFRHLGFLYSFTTVFLHYLFWCGIFAILGLFVNDCWSSCTHRFVHVFLMSVVCLIDVILVCTWLISLLKEMPLMLQYCYCFILSLVDCSRSPSPLMRPCCC